MTSAEIGCIALGLIACGAAVWAGCLMIELSRIHRFGHTANHMTNRYLMEREQSHRLEHKVSGLHQAIHHLKQHKKEHTAEANRILAELDQ